MNKKTLLKHFEDQCYKQPNVLSLPGTNHYELSALLKKVLPGYLSRPLFREAFLVLLG